MYIDNSLLPKETIRLAALGMLTDGDKTYGALANEIRHFISRSRSTTQRYRAAPNGYA